MIMFYSSASSSSISSAFIIISRKFWSRVACNGRSVHTLRTLFNTFGGSAQEFTTQHTRRITLNWMWRQGEKSCRIDAEITQLHLFDAESGFSANNSHCGCIKANPKISFARDWRRKDSSRFDLHRIWRTTGLSSHCVSGVCVGWCANI